MPLLLICGFRVIASELCEHWKRFFLEEGNISFKVMCGPGAGIIGNIVQ